ncbi:MAG: DNA primase small subunit PriS [Halobacteriaceae archaeon]
MEERTRAYLRGRFRDYYRRTDITPPPDFEAREWGYIPWTSGPDTTMVRHKSILDFGSLEDFLERERPRHIYFSAGRYESPGAGNMEEKEWIGSDLVFDLDADHLPTVELGKDSYAEMLAKCKQEVLQLIDFLENDFGFSDLTVVFSGGRGYHVHVRDPSVQELASEARREIVDYIRGTGLEFDSVIEEKYVGGTAGRKSPAPKRQLPTSGGWGKRIHDQLLEVVSNLQRKDEQVAIQMLTEYEGIGTQKAKSILGAIETNLDEIKNGNIDVHPSFTQFVRNVAEDTIDQSHAHIDEPVTTDTNRLMRLPGSLHGGSGFVVRRIDRDHLNQFEPLTDAIPDTFQGHTVTVEVDEPQTLTFGGETFTVKAGEVTLPEYQAIFLMARGNAEKGKE